MEQTVIVLLEYLRHIARYERSLLGYVRHAKWLATFGDRRTCMLG